MHCILLMVLGLLCSQYGSGYVLVQVRKQGDNLSNVDAVIHKVVPTDKVEKIASKFARKQFSPNVGRAKSEHYPNVDNYVFADNNGDKKGLSKTEANDDVVGNIVKAIGNFFTSHPEFRTQDYIKPEIIHFRSGKPSMMFEINSKAIIKALNKLLSSKNGTNYVDNITKNAAVVYRTFQDDLKKV